jgi:ribonuclease D
MDTRYLIALSDKLRGELEALGRWGWAQEEFARMESIRFRETNGEEEPWRKMKNLGNLDRRSLAIVRDLHAWRDGLARAADRPAFKIIGNEAILDMAKERPVTPGDLAKIKSVSQYHRNRYGVALLGIIRAAMAIPEEQLPARNEPKAWIRDKALENRINQLKKVRDKVAAELKIEPGVLAPRHVLAAIAETGSLDDIPAMRSWQRDVLGEKLRVVLKGKQVPPPS